MVTSKVIKPDLDKITEPRESFTNVKAALISGEIASSFRMGVILGQRQPEEKTLCPVAYNFISNI